MIVCLYTTKPAMNIKQTKFKNFTFTNASQFEDAELTPIVSSLGWLDCNLSAGDSPLEVEEILREMRDWGVRLVDNKGKMMVRGD